MPCAPSTAAMPPSAATPKFARTLIDFLNGADALDASTDDRRRFVAHLLTHRSPATAAARYRSLQQFYGWAVRDGLIDTNPMTTMRPLTVPERPFRSCRSRTCASC